MTRLERLKREARQAAAFRGHDLGPFRAVGSGRWAATCRTCGATAVVIPRPLPNEVEVFGAAVGGNCPAGGTKGGDDA